MIRYAFFSGRCFTGCQSHNPHCASVSALWHRRCQIWLYQVIKVIVIQTVLVLVLPVSWLASARPLEVWHPLRCGSVCQHSLLYFTALRQVTDLAPKHGWQAEIRGTAIEWQGFDQSPRAQTHTQTLGISSCFPWVLGDISWRPR